MKIYAVINENQTYQGIVYSCTKTFVIQVLLKTWRVSYRCTDVDLIKNESIIRRCCRRI